MHVALEMKEIEQFDWWRARGPPLILYTSGQTLKVKGLQSAYMATFFGTFGVKSSASRQEFGHTKNGKLETQTLVER